MSIPFNKVRVRVHLDRLAANYRLLAERGGAVFPVVKADAYGHGLAEVAPVLAEAGAELFFVGTVEEAVFLRSVLRDRPAAGIVSLLGPLDRDEYPLLWEHGIIPFVSRAEQLDILAGLAAGRPEGLEIALKFDTGMSRLGFGLEDVEPLLRALRTAGGLRVGLVCSHLATADEPDDPAYARLQGERFQAICAGLRAGGLDFRAVLANSAGLLAHPDLRFDGQRGGIALYGVNPFQGTAWEHLGQGVSPAMEVTTRVVAVRDLRPGQSISYGRTYTADRAMRAAIVAAGYADGYSRSLSNTGYMHVAGRRVPIIGRVCMQLTAVDVSGVPDVRPGDEVHLLGGPGPDPITPDELAAWWGTIPYEVFCLLGLNPRTHVRGTDGSGA
jgi:alanine racemase